MNLSTYESLITNQPPFFAYSKEAKESKNSYHILTERHLQIMWLEQKYFKPLTLNGIKIEVLSPGIWNNEAGPDFLKAHIKIGNQEWRGDIELHLSQQGWYHHHHHTDINYNQVILHVCYWESASEKQTLTSEGKPIFTAYIQPSLTIPEARILKLIDIDLYPYKRFAGSGQCSNTLFNHLSLEKTQDLLRSAATWRLKDKMERLQTKIENPKDYLLGGIAMVLGYKHNPEIFLEIFNTLNLCKNETEDNLLALTLGLCNFYSLHFQAKWNQSSYYKDLEKTFFSLNQKPLFHLKLDKIRPANHPVRRLAALVKMVKDPYFQSLESHLFALWQEHWNACNLSKWKKLKENFTQLIPTYCDPYWECHYNFEKMPHGKTIALMGKDLKKEILVNVYLPILYKKIEGRNYEKEKNAFLNFYSSIPASKTKKSTYLNFRFFGNKQKSLPFSSIDLQQGAYQIHRDFCVHFEASCQGCPFVDRYKNLLNNFLEQAK